MLIEEWGRNMKKVTKIVSAVVIVCAVWIGSMYYSDSSKKSPIELLFTIEAKHGSLVHIKDDRYKLEIPRNDIKSVLAFSERPNRIAYKMDTAKYIKMVHTGENNFDVNPPNLVLSWGDSKQGAEAYEVIGYHHSKRYLTYSLKHLSQEKIANRGEPIHQKGEVSIFIDTSAFVAYIHCLSKGGEEKTYTTDCHATDATAIATCLRHGYVTGYLEWPDNFSCHSYSS